MADRKITELTALTAQAAGDLLTIVDVSEAAAVDKNKKITVESLFKGIPSNVGIGTGSPFNTGTNYGSLDIAGTDGGEISLSDGGTAKGRLFNYATNSDLIGLAAKATAGQLVFSTGGDAASAERMRIDSSGRVAIGVTNPGHQLTVRGTGSNTAIANFFGGTVGRGLVISTSNDGGTGDDTVIYNATQASGRHVFQVNASEKARIDSNGRLLVGTSTALTGGGTQFAKLVSLGNSSGANSSGIVAIGRNHAATSLVAGNTVGEIYFADTANGHFASITCAADANTGTNDYPGRLVFSTTADGASSPTERLRIDSSGQIKIPAGSFDLRVGDDIDANAGTQTISVGSVSSGSGGLQCFANPTNGQSYLQFGDASASASQYRGYVGYKHADDALVFGSVSTERLRIDSSGRLFVNHTADVAPDGYDSKLQLCDNSYQGSSVVLRRDQNNTSGGTLIFAKSRSSSKGGNAIVNDGDDCGSIRWYGNDGADINNEVARIRAEVDGTPGSNDMPGRLRFYTTADGASSPTERMRIANQGDTYHFGATDVLFVASAAVAGTTYELIRGGHTATAVAGGTTSFRVYTNGNVQNTNNSFSQISDVKLKENIVDANSQWDDLKAVQVRNFNFKAETGHSTHTQIGVVAQEIEVVSPGLVYETPDLDAEGEDLGTVTKAVSYSVLYMKAIKALQEAMERIETLETKVAALEAG